MSSLRTYLKNDPSFNTPNELLEWMEKHLTYHGVPKKYLYSPKDVLKFRKAHCWESCSFEYSYLEKMGFSCTIIYLENSDCTTTHTALFFSTGEGDFYWFEWAWRKYKGIHKYKDYKSLIADIREKFKKDNELSFMSEGHTLIDGNTLQSNYYSEMKNVWERTE